VEAAARRALHEVADAVTGFRRPSLAVELRSARRAVAGAGIRCLLEVPHEWRLPPDVDALLAWAAREAATNVIRHSAATRCDIRLVMRPGRAALEVSDDGTGPAAAAGERPGGEQPGGNGLAGLAERAGRLGGTLSAGTEGGRGFRLRVSVPVGGAR
jgi:two-component system sensor histidine kinase DesK